MRWVGRRAAALLAVAAAVLAGACWPAAAGPATTAPAGGLSVEQKGQLYVLKRQAGSRDAAESMGAIAKIEAMGTPAAAELGALLKALLSQNAAAIEMGARRAGGTRADAIAAKLAELRTEALANVDKLNKDDDSLAKALAYHKQLTTLTGQYAPVLAARSKLLDDVLHYLALVAVQARLGAAPADVAADRPGPSPVELAGKVLGAALSKPATEEELRKEAALRPILDYRLNRKTELYNRQLVRSVNREEMLNTLMVNVYREALGLGRLELDERLIQSARRHSKEMGELKYFSHESPTEGNKSFADRIKKAGYGEPGGENIAAGSPSGVQTFWQWFNSPGHHQNMVREGFTGLGVGKWNKVWTQNFGRGKRLALADDAAREAARPAGPILRPGR